MRILLLGAPGSGKGTQAKALAGMYGLLHVAPGDVFRQEVKAKTDLGRLVQGIMARGELVSDDITVRIIENKLDSQEAGFVLDGFPRNVAQAEALDRMLGKNGTGLSVVFHLAVSVEEVLKRAKSRRVCSGCGRPYNLSSEPPEVAGTCDCCGGKLVSREDDKEDTVKDRLAVYRKATEPLVQYYRDKGLLEEIDGSRPVAEVTADLAGLLEQKGIVRRCNR